MEQKRFFGGRFIGLILVLAIVGGYFLIKQKTNNENQNNFPKSHKDTTYDIDGLSVTLVNGYAEQEAVPNSSEKIITNYFGNESRGDLNGDGLEDIAFLITQTSGGTGTFYYVVAAIQIPVENMGYMGTNAILLGDRISPQTTEIKNGELIVNYADRLPGEPMSARPSQGISTYLKVQDNQLLKLILP